MIIRGYVMASLASLDQNNSGEVFVADLVSQKAIVEAAINELTPEDQARTVAMPIDIVLDENTIKQGGAKSDGGQMQGDSKNPSSSKHRKELKLWQA